MAEKNHIAILHYKTIDKTIECVESIINNVTAYHILIIDNHSNDGTIERLQRLYNSNPNVEFLLLDSNLGFARANNIALNLLYGRGVKRAVLANNDIVFQTGAVERMMADLQNGRNILLVAPRILSPAGEIQDTVQIKTNNAKVYFFYKCFPFFEKKTKSSMINSQIKVRQFSGSCFACDVEKMHRIGNFDERTFLYYEELILSEKAHGNNLEMIYEPEAKVIHYHGATTKSINYMIHYYLLESEACYLQNYLHMNKVIMKLYLWAKRESHRMKYHSKDLYTKESELICKVMGSVYEKH